MAIVAGIVRAQQRADAWERAHPEAGAMRVMDRAIQEQALADTKDHFGAITPNNIEAMDEWRKQRALDIRWLMQHRVCGKEET